MRVVDIQLSFPAILIALILLAMLGQGVGKIIVALVTVQWAYYARTVRSAALVERQKEYIEAAQVLALSRPRIVLRHLLPNCLPPLIVVATVQVAHAIPLEADALVPRPRAADHRAVARAAHRQRLPVPALGQILDQLLPGPGAAAHHRRHQPGRRPAARRAQPEAQAMSAPLLEVDGPADAFLHQGGRGEGRRRRELRGRARAHPGARGRIGLGQVDDRLLDHGPGRSARDASSPGASPLERRRPHRAGARRSGASCGATASR